MEIVACPPDNQIVKFLLGELPEREATALAAHAKNCSRCLEAMRSLDKITQTGETKPVSVPPVKPSNSASRRTNKKLSFLSPPQSDDEIGWLAHYRILKVLGEGGMGMVLQAEDTDLERPVALKVIKDQFRDDESAQQRFMREARAMAQVKSDHVVTVHQVAQHNDICFIAMELLDGAPLSSLLDEDRLPPIRETLRIARETAQALAAAHARGLIHRDIKPDNLWLEAPSGRVKVLDFGLARPQQSDIKLTFSGMIIGSPLYMSPEQARAGEVDERTDLFSLGCVLYTLITGQPPFARLTIMDTILALANEIPEPPSHWAAECPQRLDGLILRLLAKDPEQRPSSAQLVIEQLEAIEADLSSDRAEPKGGAPMSPSVWLQARQREDSQMTGALSSSNLSSMQHSSLRRSERRQVTVLVCGCELFESEEYLENLDAEDQENVLRHFEQACSQAVVQASGAIVQCNNENLIACFGYPIAQEDACEQAINAALSILEALMELGANIKKTHNIELKPWLAIHTGPAIVAIEGSTISLVGEARTVALRLRDFAIAGQIVLSEAAHILLRGKCACLSLGQHKIKGVERPIEVFRLDVSLEAGDAASTYGASELTPLTGRDMELNLLKERWEQALEGMGHVVLLIGEAGLGKSRLVQAMKQHVGAALPGTGPLFRAQAVQDSNVIEWRCSPHFRNSGLYPASEFFQRLLGFRRGESPTAQFDRLVKHLEQYGLATKEVVPLFASLLNLPSDDTRFPSLSLSPARERENMFQALKDWLQAYMAKRPVLFVIEDLHWLDASTLEFLAQLLISELNDRILMLLTFRPEFRTPWPALAHQTNLALNRLTKRQVSELMRNKTGTNVPDAVIDQVFERSGGVPLFVEEFTKMVEDSGMLAEDDDGQIKSLMARAIPATLQDLIMARLDRMEGDRELAQLASALGREFSYELLSAVSNADDRVLEAELAKLVQAEILFQKGRPPQSSYVFKHALLEDALYNAMVKTHRQQCHAQIAEALEERFVHTVQTQPEVLAHHLTEAGFTEKAISYWLIAGLRCQQEKFANVEAISHFTRGLELLKTLPESCDRDRVEFSLLNPLGSAYQLARGYAAPEVGPTFARARELGQKIGNRAQLFETMWGNWTWHLVRSDLDLCMKLADEMMTLAASAQDKAMIMEAYVAPAVTHYFRGNYSECRKLCEKAIDEYEDLEQCKIWSARLGQHSAVVLRNYLSLALWHLGFPERAFKVNSEALAISQMIAQPFSLCHALYYSCWLYYFAGMWDELETAAKEQEAIAIDQKFALWQSTVSFHIGATALHHGEVDEAIKLLEEGIRSFKAIDATLTLPAQFAVLAEAYIEAGRFDDAKKALEDGLTQGEKNADRTYLSELHRLKGILSLAADNDAAGAEKFFNEAIIVSRGHGSKYRELRSTINLAELWGSQGKIDEARHLLSTACNAYTEGSTNDVLKAKHLLASLLP